MPSVVEYSESALRGKLTSAQGEFVSPWLAERDDVCLFAGAATKLDNNKERLLVVTRYRLGVFGKSLGGRWKFRELRLLELRGLEVAGGGERATWTFADGETVELKCRTLQEAARATLHAYGLLTLCLDNLPPLYQQLPAQWGAMAADLAGSFPDMGFSRAWLAQCSYGGAEKAEKPTAVEKARRLSGDRGGGGGGGGFGGGGGGGVCR